MSTEIDRQAIAAGHWRLHPRVALRPEPFGALAYHYGNRRLNFLRSPDLVTVVKALGDAATVTETLETCNIPEVRRPAFEKALLALARSDFLVRLDSHSGSSSCANQDDIEHDKTKATVTK